MKRIILYLSLAIFLLGAAVIHLTQRSVRATPPESEAASNASANTIAAPGRVEPLSEEIKIGSEMAGKLRAVLVEEGDRVRRGQVVAVLENDDYRARLASAEAELELKEAELRRIRNGARPQERDEASAQVREADAVLENTRSAWVRRQALLRSGDLSRMDYEQAEREYAVAQARHQAALQRHSLINDTAREEDLARAEAAVRLARARVEEAQAMLDKTNLRSPLDGVVLRKYANSGESVKDTSEPPILTVGDVKVWRVRVDVDETDVAQIRPGQRAYVTADAYGDRKFWGRVVRIGQILGRKNIRTDEPTERVDTKILETLVELKDGQALHAGLRVTAYLLIEEPPQTTHGGR